MKSRKEREKEGEGNDSKMEQEEEEEEEDDPFDKSTELTPIEVNSSYNPLLNVYSSQLLLKRTTKNRKKLWIS